MLTLTILTTTTINFSTINVTSGHIDSLSYNLEHEILLVHFSNGSVYKYNNVSESLFTGFFGIEKVQDEDNNTIFKPVSVGRYFNKNIRNNPNYSFEKL
jgi:hypothetical protein